MNATENAWPTEIRLAKDRRTLTVSFDTGESFDLPAEQFTRQALLDAVAR